MPLKDLQIEGPQRDGEKLKHEETDALDDADWEHVGTSIDEKETAEEECTEDKQVFPPSEVVSERPERRWQGLRRQEDEAKGNVVSELLFFLAGLFLWAV
ncbi:hypothetical protein CaCOL14_002732 [Colletotrichum acutatum]